MLSKNFVLGMALAMSLTACSVRKLAVRQVAGALRVGMPATESEVDLEHAASALPALLKMTEGLLLNDPQNRELLGLLTEGYTSYAFLFIEDHSPQRAKKFYRRAKGYGLRLLKGRGLIPEEITNPEAWTLSLAGARRKDVAAIFWTANAWGLEINLSRDDPMALVDLPISAVLAEKALALNADYYFGSPDSFLGFYHASRPKMLGGKPAKSKEHFEASLGRNGGKFLLTKVLMAGTYAVQAQDRELFERLLEEVLGADDDLFPEAALANAVAKVKAKRLLEKTDELF